MTHTPTPWTATANIDAGPYGPSWTVRVDKQVVVASISGAALHGGQERAEANAAFIVRAVNAHDELVAALEGMMLPHEKGWKVTDWTLRMADARAALAKARP